MNINKLFALNGNTSASALTQVALTQATSYDRVLVKERVQHLFESIGGIGDIVGAGKKVAIKINLTGGGGGSSAYNMWTHPEVLRAVGELILDSGVSANNLYIVEALWNSQTYASYGYQSVQQGLGAQLVDLNGKAPYTDFTTMTVGSESSNYPSFTVNGILQEIDVYVSIPKMKQHYEAGVTGSLKNQIGIVPRQLYTTPTNTGRRDALHTKDGTVSSTTHLPGSICDLNLARPVHLAVIDGIQNARGGEGNWNPTFVTCEDHVLLAGKDPVATDSVMAHLMGNDPEAATLHLPSGGQCDNHLYILHQKGVGTNLLSEIQPVGDGAGLMTSVRPGPVTAEPDRFKLFPNYPNPFNPSTTFRFFLPAAANVTITVYAMNGQRIETLLDGRLSQGLHEVYWDPRGIASGAYLCEARAGNARSVIKMIYQK